MSDFGWGDIHKDATISDCLKYRYELTRRWEHEIDHLREVAFVMLNPSTADHFRDDPTIRRCIQFAKSWNFGGLSVVNLFAFRSTDPKALKSCDDPIGPENDTYLRGVFDRSELVVVAWGNHGVLRGRDIEVLKMIDDPHCLDITKSKCPKHPLYIKGDTDPVPFKTR